MHAERFKRAEMLFTSEDRWRIKYLDKKRWVKGKPQKATVVDSLLWCLLGVCEGVSPSEGTPLLFQLHPTLLMTKVCRSFCHSALILQCLSNKYHVLHKLLYVTVGSQSQSGKDSPAEAKLSWSYGTWYEEQMRCYNHAESKEMTDYKYSSSCTVLKHLSRNLSKNPYPCIRCSKLTRHIKCIYFCIGLPTALSPWSFSSHTPSPSYFPPQSLQGRDLCDSTCFQRHSGITAHRLQES